MKTIFIILLMITVGCTTIPNGGYHGDLSQLGKPGAILATVRLGEGLLVGTAQLDNNRFVNLQINKEEVPKSEPLYYARTLTIGKFSKLWGSGFTKGENIYYQKRIWYDGKDVFAINGDRYLVEWHYDERDSLSFSIADMYIVTFRTLDK